QVKNGYLKPYKDRRDIEKKPATKKDSLLWLASAEDKFFLQIQGSGTVQLPDESIVHVGYAGNNGKPYVSIGKVLKESGELKKVSMETIRQWLADHPEKQEWLFNQNPRYIFFRENDEGAITAQGVPATAGRTLAV
ncbi:MltA domain-containing protein, partial [Sinorhizobium meliloti]